MIKRKVILTIGISGAGKTTYVEKYCSKDKYVILCPDKFRGIIGKDQGDQSVNHPVFATMRAVLEYLLKYDDRDVVIDATSYSKANRKDFINIAHKCDAHVVAWCFGVPLEVAKERNRKRSRVVPDEIIERQFARLDIPTTPEVDEVILITNSNLYLP